MSNVTLQIGGRQYLVACAEGEEAHVARLGQAIEAKVQEIGAGGTNETQMLLFAALLLADENHELKARGGSDAAALAALADRLEQCAAALEG